MEALKEAEIKAAAVKGMGKLLGVGATEMQDNQARVVRVHRGTSSILEKIKPWSFTRLHSAVKMLKSNQTQNRDANEPARMSNILTRGAKQKLNEQQWNHNVPLTM